MKLKQEMLDGSKMLVVMVRLIVFLRQEKKSYIDYNYTEYNKFTLNKRFQFWSVNGTSKQIFCSVSENNVFVGNRYFKDEKSTRLIFGNDGIIAGIQATVS